MITISKRLTNHVFEKQNSVTRFEKGRHFDVYKCSLCGLTGKAYSLTHITIDGRSKGGPVCPKAPKASKIKITECRAVGKAFGNLTPDSIHDIIPPPKDKDNSRGVWVMGVGEPVLVLFGEFQEVKE